EVTYGDVGRRRARRAAAEALLDGVVLARGAEVARDHRHVDVAIVGVIEASAGRVRVHHADLEHAGMMPEWHRADKLCRHKLRPGHPRRPCWEGPRDRAPSGARRSKVAPYSDQLEAFRATHPNSAALLATAEANRAQRLAQSAKGPRLRGIEELLSRL